MAINLLPLKEKRSVRMIYRAHYLIAVLIVVGLLLLSALVLLAALSINIRQEKTFGLKTLSTLSQQKQVLEFNQLRDRVNTLAKYISAAKNITTSDALPTKNFEAILAVKPNGVSLTNLEYAVDQDGSVIKLGGVAASRQALLAFTSSLQLLPQVKSVDSPVANLISNVDATFSLTVVLNKITDHE